MLIQDYQNIVEFLMRQPFFLDSLHKTLKDFGVAKEDKTGMYMAILTSHIFAPNSKGQTPFDYYMRSTKLNIANKELFKLWRESNFFSMFEVLKVGSALEIQDIVTGKSYEAIGFIPKSKIDPGDLLAARIVPQDLTKRVWLVLSGTVLYYPEEGRRILKEAFKKDPADSSASTLADELYLIKYIYAQNT